MDKTLKIALIGPGRMGLNYAKVIVQNPYAELVAICGNSYETTQKNGASFNLPIYYNNKWDEMFTDHPEIDTVIIATSEWAHLPPFRAAIKAGKNIILEKPVAVSPEEYQEMEDLVNMHPELKVLVCFTCRFDNKYIKAREYLQAGEMGAIGYIYSRRNADSKTASRILGKFPTPYWIIVHDIDLMLWMTGSKIKEVHAVQSNHTNGGNLLIVNLLFENGTRGLIESIFYSKPISGQDHTRMDIECEKGKIELDFASGGIVRFTEGGSEYSDVTDFNEVYGHLYGNTPSMIHHFINVIRNEVTPAATFEDGVKAVKVSSAIQSSLLKGEVISMFD